MRKPQEPMKAIVVSKPRIHDYDDVEALAYEAEMQYKRKAPEVKLILCTPLDDIEVGDTVDLVYQHSTVVNKRAYQHKYSCLSNSSNTYGGYYYTNGSSA